MSTLYVYIFSWVSTKTFVSLLKILITNAGKFCGKSRFNSRTLSLKTNSPGIGQMAKDTGKEKL